MTATAQTISRRSALAGIALAAVTLSACSVEANEIIGTAGEQIDPVVTSATAPSPDGSVDVAKLMEAGALPEKALGDPNAPVTIVEYASMTCGHCANFHKTTLPEIKKNYIDTGKVRLIMREFPFDPRAAAGFMLARCAPNDNYFPMIDVLFQQQSAWAGAQNAREALLQISRQAGFTQESFEACLTDQKLLDDVNAVRERGAKEFGVSATPTFFINGNKYAGSLSVEEMSAIIDSLL